MDEKTYLGTSTEPLMPPTSDEKTMAVLSHILTLLAPVIAPLIIYLIKKDESEFVKIHSLESLNFQITVAIVVIALAITIVGLLLIWLVGLLDLVFVVIATIRASEGKLYRYPFSFRFIK